MVLNRETDNQSDVAIKYGNEPIKKAKSTMNLGVERNKTEDGSAGTADHL